MTQRHERGAVGTIVGVLLAVGVVFGFLAISVDVGGLLWERRQLQNAADAAALSLATECATGANCSTAGNLQAFVDENSNDLTSTVMSDPLGAGETIATASSDVAALAEAQADADVPPGFEDLNDAAVAMFESFAVALENLATGLASFDMEAIQGVNAQIEAAVVSPLMMKPSRMMTPAPTKPRPVTMPCTTRVGSVPTSAVIWPPNQNSG